MSPPSRFGPYSVMATLAAKADGRAVYQAIDERDPSRRVALKVLFDAATSNAEARARFLHEAELAQAIDHARIVRIIESGEIDEHLFIATELVEGVTFAQTRAWLEQTRASLPLSVVVALVSGVLEGLEALHSARDPALDVVLEAVHRDVAPTNLMIDRTGGVKIIDLGLGRSLLKTHRTATGAVFGTPGYTAPEQARGEQAGLRADLWAAGVLFFELAAGARYIKPGPMMEMLVEATKRAPVSLSTLRGDGSPALDQVLLRALAVDPSARFDSAKDMREALEAAVAPATRDEIVRALSPLLGGSKPVASAPPNRIPIALAGLMVLVAFGCAFGSTFWMAPQPTAELELIDRSDPPPVVRAAARLAPAEEPIETAPAEPLTPVRSARHLAKKVPAPEVLLDVPARIDRLLAKAASLKQGRPDLVESVNQLVAEAVLWAYANDTAKAERGLADLEARLRSLERSHP